MAARENKKVINDLNRAGFILCIPQMLTPEMCVKIGQAIRSAIDLLKEQEPRVLTLEEVINHYSLPPIYVDDVGEQEDYLEDIKPLYFDFPVDDPWAVHWRNYSSVRKYIDDWRPSYGVNWRCWTDKPTDEQRNAVQWHN